MPGKYLIEALKVYIFNEKSDLNLCPGEVCWVANSNKQTHISLLPHKLSFR